MVSTQLLQTPFEDMNRMQLILNSVLVVILVALLMHVIRFLHVYFKFGHIPGYVSILPPMLASIFAGEMYVDYGYKCTLKAFLDNPEANLVKVQNGYGIVFAVARDHDLIKEMLVRKYKTFAKDEKMWEPLALFGHNILSADSMNPIWKKHRTLANPIFSNASHLRNVFRVTVEELPHMIEYLRRNYSVDQENQSIRNVNITQELKSITLTVINKVAFDYDIQLFDKTPRHSEEMHQSIGHLLSGILYQFIFPKWFFDYIPVGIFKQFKEAKLRFHDTAMTMVRKKQAEIEQNIEMKDDEDLLSLLLKSFAAQNLSDDEKLSNDELVSAIFIIFFAGFETSSTSLNFFLRILATHPDVQERLIEEIDSNINSIDSLTFEDLTEKLPLMNSFIKESFRVKPAIGAVARTVLKKEGESIGKIHLEKGSVLICNMMVHHQLSQNTALDTFKFDRYYQDPTLEEKIDRGTMGHLALDFTKDDLIPFSLGPRDCLGKRMALIEIKVILVFLLKQFRLKVPDHLKESQSKIKEGYFMTRTTDSPFILDFETR